MPAVVPGGEGMTRLIRLTVAPEFTKYSDVLAVQRAQRLKELNN
jgi:hypothetical protein